MVQHADIDHTGLTGISSGAVATDAIWDAAGDLAVGTGANTAAKLSIGATNGMDLRRVSGAVAWAFPPGHSLSRVEYTGNVSLTNTAEASADTIVTAGAISFDGSTVVDIEFFCPGASVQATAAASAIFWLYDGSSSIGKIAQVRNVAASSIIVPVLAVRRLTPSNASHTYSIRGTTSSGTSIANAGAGGAGNFTPGHIRIMIAG